MKWQWVISHVRIYMKHVRETSKISLQILSMEAAVKSSRSENYVGEVFSKTSVSSPHINHINKMATHSLEKKTLTNEYTTL